MLDLFAELRNLTEAFEKQEIEYALCGELAMAVHGFPRATIDIDLLIRPQQLSEAERIAGNYGYTFRAMPMTIARGDVEIRRLSKIEQSFGHVLSLDFLLVTPAIEDIWRERQRYSLDEGAIWAVTRKGLIALKSTRRSPQDLADIHRLEQGP